MSWALLAPGAHSSSRGALRSLARHGAHARGSNLASYKRGILPSIALGAVVLAVASVWGWNLSGGRLAVMETPSMCPAVCVGSLVADRPLRGAVHVGELITFHPPDNRAETYTHEITHIFANGAIQTRGIADATHDPWLITRSDIVGVVDFTVWELGWVLKALPLLAVGVLFWVVARPWIGDRARRGWDSGWMTVLTVVPLWMLHPLVGATVVSSTLDASQRRHLATDTIVNTGILPVSFRATGGQSVQVSSTSVVHVSGVSVHGGLQLHEAVSMPWWGVAIVVVSVLSPLAGCLWHIWRDTEVVPDIGAGRNPVPPPTRRHRGELHVLVRPERPANLIVIEPARRVVAANVLANMRSAKPGTRCSKRSKCASTTIGGPTTRPLALQQPGRAELVHDPPESTRSFEQPARGGT